MLAFKVALTALPVVLVSAPARAADAAGSATRRGSAGITGLSGLRPDPTAIPGGAQARTLLEGVMFYGLIIAAISLVLSAALFGLGKLRRHPGHVEAGQTGLLWALAGAAGIGACGTLIGWAFNLGTAIN